MIWTIEHASRQRLETLRQQDERIEVIRGIGDSALDGSNSLEGMYSALMGDAVADRLDADFAGEEGVYIRSVQASLDKDIVGPDTTVHNLATIVRNGDIMPRSVLNLAGHKLKGERPQGSAIHYRVNQYASETPMFRQFVIGPDVPGVEAIFPALLVYDTRLMQRAEHGSYSWVLPKTAEDRARVIRKAYVLDAIIRAS